MNKEATLAALTESLDADILDADSMSEAEVDAELRAAGGDPDAIAERGRREVHRLLAIARAPGRRPPEVCEQCEEPATHVERDVPFREPDGSLSTADAWTCAEHADLDAVLISGSKLKR